MRTPKFVFFALALTSAIRQGNEVHACQGIEGTWNTDHTSLVQPPDGNNFFLMSNEEAKATVASEVAQGTLKKVDTAPPPKPSVEAEDVIAPHDGHRTDNEVEANLDARPAAVVSAVGAPTDPCWEYNLQVREVEKAAFSPDGFTALGLELVKGRYRQKYGQDVTEPLIHQAYGLEKAGVKSMVNGVDEEGVIQGVVCAYHFGPAGGPAAVQSAEKKVARVDRVKSNVEAKIAFAGLGSSDAKKELAKLEMAWNFAKKELAKLEEAHKKNGFALYDAANVGELLIQQYLNEHLDEHGRSGSRSSHIRDRLTTPWRRAKVAPAP